MTWEIYLFSSNEYTLSVLIPKFLPGGSMLRHTGDKVTHLFCNSFSLT